MRFDYHPPLIQARLFRFRRHLKPIIATISIAVLATMIIAPNQKTTTPDQIIESKTLNISTKINKSSKQALNTIEKISQSREEWKDVKVRHGDSLSKIFSEIGLTPTSLYNLLKATPISKQLSSLYPGQTISFLLDDDHELKAITLKISPIKTLHIRKTSSDYKYYYEEKQLSKKLAFATNKIIGSLYSSAQASGIDDKLTMQLANIFGWDIDFVLDIRENDSFRIVYEEEYLDDQKVDTGNILAAEFINKGKSYKAVRYTDPSGKTGYYTPKGYSMQKAFLRTPVKFTRISSHFSTGRKHPILHRIRAHKGVDYAAPHGTPIKATGDGKVKFIGRKGGYGNAIELQHGRKYSTLYAHLSRFARKLRTGSYVKQGQIIGYVGHTGLARGDHLHYEFRVNGIHRNPLTVSLPKSSPVAKVHREYFLKHANKMISLMDEQSSAYVAKK